MLGDILLLIFYIFLDSKSCIDDVMGDSNEYVIIIISAFLKISALKYVSKKDTLSTIIHKNISIIYIIIRFNYF